MSTKAKKPVVLTAASVVIYNAADMTLEGRKKVAKWLRSRASWLEKHGDLAAPRFVQRYLYEYNPSLAGPRPRTGSPLRKGGK